MHKTTQYSTCLTGTPFFVPAFLSCVFCVLAFTTHTKTQGRNTVFLCVDACVSPDSELPYTVHIQLYT